MQALYTILSKKKLSQQNDATFKQERRFFRAYINTDKKQLRFAPHVSKQGFFALTHTEKSC